MKKSPTVIAGVALLLAATGWTQETDPANEPVEQWQAEQVERDARQARLDELMTTLAEEMQVIRAPAIARNARR